MTLREKLLETVPDEPGWVEFRSALLAGGSAFGTPDDFVVASPNGALVCVAGEPPRAALQEALLLRPNYGDLLARPESARAVELALGRPGERAIIHSCESSGWSGGAKARLLGPDDASLVQHAPFPLRQELTNALALGVAVVFVGEVAAGFCYPAALSENWWDVAVDTLEAHRRKGLARSAFARMAAKMQQHRPVWGAVESNEASLSMASKLGFEPVDELLVW